MNEFTSNNCNYYFYGNYKFPIDFIRLLKDGNTIAFYDSNNLDTITKNNNIVTKITDVLQSGYDLEDGVCGYDVNDGFTFDGTQSIKTLLKTTKQPFFVYLVVKQITWNDLDTIFDGYNFQSCRFIQYGGTGNNFVGATAGNISQTSDLLGFGEYSIVRIFFNGANSFIKINENITLNWGKQIPWIGNLGFNNPLGFTLGDAKKDNQAANFAVKAVVLRKSTSKEETINSFLKETYLKTLSFNSGKLVFSWDGDLMPYIYKGHKIMKENNLKDTLFLCTHGGGGTDNAAMWNYIDLMYNNGTDLQLHSYDHVKFTDLTQQEIIDNIALMDNNITTIHGYPLSKFLAYAYGYSNVMARQTTLNLKIHARGLRESMLYGKPSYKGDLPCIWLGDNTNSIEGINKIKGLIDYAVKYNTVLLLYCHGLDQGGNGQESIPFTQIMEHARSVGIESLTHTELEALL